MFFIVFRSSKITPQNWCLLDSVQVVMQRKNLVTKKLEEKQMMPVSSLHHFFYNCHSFDLSPHNNMRGLEVRSNWLSDVLQIHMQLSAFIQFEKGRTKNPNFFPNIFLLFLLIDLYKKYDVTVLKTINLNTAERACYEGEDYNDQEYLRLAQMIRAEVGCTSTFFPAHLRDGLEDLLVTNLASINLNLWSSDFYFVPPCVFYEFSLKEKSRKPLTGWVIWIQPNCS